MDSAIPGDIWPEWCRSQPWLVDFLDRVYEEATRFGQQSIYFQHVVLAFVDLDGDPKRFLAEANVDVLKWRDRAIFSLGLNDGMDVFEFQKYPSPGETPKRIHSEVIELLEFAAQEATHAQTPIDGKHLFVAIANHGLEGTTVARARELVGFAPTRRVMASGEDRGLTYRPRAITPIILCGGDERLVLEEAIGFSRQSRSAGNKAKVAVVFVDHPRDDLAWVEKAGAAPVDAGLYQREDAFSAEVIQKLSEADVICFPGGDPEPKYEALIATPALEAISEASNRGAVILGNSGGAMIWGSGVLSRWESFDELQGLPMLSWLDNIIVYPHYRGFALQDDQLRELAAAFPSASVLAIAHLGAVLVEPGWRSVRSLRTWGEYRSAWIESVEDRIKILD